MRKERKEIQEQEEQRGIKVSWGTLDTRERKDCQDRLTSRHEHTSCQVNEATNPVICDKKVFMITKVYVSIQTLTSIVVGCTNAYGQE